ncbi:MULTISPECIES: GNAT family N-acetyltransferase [Staphylococcus]|uniref:GNAT family N-acetyltransferase n=1 Tax=Staphylococcus shinii TaxID=2912228 RepID=UPI000C31CBE8|nr:GNAT family N-acetyltransferase [Staphylococcus shinii]PKI11640.1 GNAT family N-acetyltransferase [Staphylococcus shinii]PTI03039.1 GNAT family N-acetyltransferase [Staphylococcus shinii]RIM91035.1 GNAT family N-acetyltransferase [Staphylococcus shinii]
MFKIVTTQTMLEEAHNIRKKVFVEEQSVPLENEIDQYETMATHIIGYDKDDMPFATGRLRPIDNGVKIERVAILATHRNKGYGKLLMEFLEKVAKDQGYQRLMLNAQYHAQGFYESLGYQSFGETFMEENIKHIAMTKIM